MAKLADIIVDHSCKIQPGEKVFIGLTNIPPDMACLLINKIGERGGMPFIQLGNPRISKAMYNYASPEQMSILARRDLAFAKEMDHFISLVAEDNLFEFSDVPEDNMKIVLSNWSRPVCEYIDSTGKWVFLRWPTPAMAQFAGMSAEAFEDYFFDVCTLDYEKMTRAGAPLMDRLSNTDIVRIKGVRDTDIEFSVQGIPVGLSAGERNIPDGEVFTAPIKESVNGVINFNTRSVYNGKCFEDIRLVFKNGKIIEAVSSDTSTLNDILDTDSGSRYIGEFAFGINPHIKRAMQDSLFDEKISGSIHLTPGQSLNEANNGNSSGIHWDMVMIQTPEYGGGEIYFDGELIRKNGLFVSEYLHCLNPESLLCSEASDAERVLCDAA